MCIAILCAYNCACLKKEKGSDRISVWGRVYITACVNLSRALWCCVEVKFCANVTINLSTGRTTAGETRERRLLPGNQAWELNHQSEEWTWISREQPENALQSVADVRELTLPLQSWSVCVYMWRWWKLGGWLHRRHWVVNEGEFRSEYCFLGWVLWSKSM